MTNKIYGNCTLAPKSFRKRLKLAWQILFYEKFNLTMSFDYLEKDINHIPKQKVKEAIEKITKKDIESDGPYGCQFSWSEELLKELNL